MYTDIPSGKIWADANRALFFKRSDSLDFPSQKTVCQTQPSEWSIWVNYKYTDAYQGYVLVR